MKKKVMFYLLYFFITCALLVTSVLFAFGANSKIHVNYFPKDDFDDAAEILSPANINKLPDINGKQFTCTGMTFNSFDNTFWFCNFGKDYEDDNQTASLVQMNNNFTSVLNIIELNSDEHLNLQGITFDSVNNTIWYTTGNYLIEIDYNGNELNRYPTEYTYNGLLFDKKTNGFYVLCYKKYLLKITKNNEIVETNVVNYKDQDHMCFDNDNNILITAGADYKGDNNYVINFNVTTKKKTTLYKVLESYAVEGIFVFDSTLYICNDGYYHDCLYKYNYVASYTLK